MMICLYPFPPLIHPNVVITQNGGSYVLACDASPESVLSVWQWQWGHLLGKVAVSRI